MCGIVGAVANRDIVPLLIAGLKSLEYRGYDSAGLAVADKKTIIRRRAAGKIAQLEQEIANKPISGYTGIAHTRWATHGAPTQQNAHPHISGKFAVVHNGIIENYATLKSELEEKGYTFSSQTDTEVIVHYLDFAMQNCNDAKQACKQLINKLSGAYALGIIYLDSPNTLYAIRKGSPLCVGLGIKENFIASDVQALLRVTSNFIFLEDGDFAQIEQEKISIEDKNGKLVDREIASSSLMANDTEKGKFAHFMEKEIYEQATVITATIRDKIHNNQFIIKSLGENAKQKLKGLKSIHIVACGTSFHAAMVAKYWIEKYAALPCQVEVASEYRYRDFVVAPDCMFIAISQSGETADTLAALRHAKQKNYNAYLGICNVAESSLTRESDLVFLTAAGVEKSVASTKAFTTQLAALLLITEGLATVNGRADAINLSSLINIEPIVEKTLSKAGQIKAMAEHLYEKKNAIFLGRGALYPVALEGSLKLKEISYIHAEGYPAGELKHGPLALVDEDMPIVAVVYDNDLAQKLKSNLEEVKARGGKLFVFADEKVSIENDANTNIIQLPSCEELVSPIVFTLPLQLLSYYVALLLGTDVDQPRNLAKSVTVE